MIKAIRTDCYSGVSRDVEIDYEVKTFKSLAGLWFCIIRGAVTGYESFQLTTEAISRTSKEGWWACAGTQYRWDSLFIPAEEMTKALRELVFGKDNLSN
jgi:hypothetical protein